MILILTLILIDILLSSIGILPSLIGTAHGKLCPAMILDLPSAINQGLTSNKVLALRTFAFLSTHHTGFKALAIFFETSGLFAATSHVVA